ncbi:uncharacterized protein LOC106179957 [Lingula anatina]|uniref:Uncharacterized protein LOC106179957 n=1 Tax=Lingula anatina TaxID=7574 RepID=A0A1S3K9D5_LINAN|nr:uncharacterized protein LOC106179957 [Lingula anatina]|eukprot:XP_013419238.1 uncharacterized protein LOC106179957 [Lingula anatina]
MTEYIHSLVEHVHTIHLFNFCYCNHRIYLFRFISCGGLAGLSAALELAERGYDVTVKEKSDVFGGKLFTRRVDIPGLGAFDVEHGFHAWFFNYHQFKDIRRRLKIDNNFRVWKAVHYIFLDYKPETIYSEGPYPLNLLARSAFIYYIILGIISRSPNIKLTDAILSSLMLPDLDFFDYDTVYQKYDNITFDQWATMRGVQRDLNDILLRPALSVTLNEPRAISAAEMLMYMQLYFLTNAEADHREVTIYSFGKAILQPWLDRLSELHVKLHSNYSVERLTISDQGQVTGDSKDAVVYDHVVSAMDIVGTQSVLNATLSYYGNKPIITDSLSKLWSKVSHMKLAPPYKVLRVWFDKQLNASTPDILETPQHTPVNLVAQYHRLEQEASAWANKTGGSVLEFHLYKWAHGDVADDQVWTIISPTVKLIYPEIFERMFNILGYHVNSFENFSSFELNLQMFRPNSSFPMECGLPNLHLAGDWLKTAYPSALMERAVSTGREAANQILLSDRVKQVELIVTSSKGPGIL